MRVLTPGEIALLRDSFPRLLPYDRVRLRFGHGGNPAAMAAFRNGNTAITLRRTVYFRTHYSEDFADGDVAAQSLFHHEMTHVWQYAALGLARFLARYARDLVACRFSPSAMYRYDEGETAFAGARIEAQAQMVGDFCRARLLGDTARQARLARNLEGSGFFGFEAAGRRPAASSSHG
ncbi:MAG: hypothetical protein QOG72_245 [Sphingomonadales bacterium]|jgi:hypothetical protein|nr:hypothetical protein [Sphingomonadales bacterium]